MLAMTVGAYGSIPHAARNRFSMDALAIGRKNVGMTPAASLGDFQGGNLRSGIAGGKYGVCAMAIRADSAALSRSNGAGMNAL